VEEIRALQEAVKAIYIDELLEQWIVRIVEATRRLNTVVIGASVRGSLALERSARSAALLAGRSYVVPSDVEALILPVLGHRISFTPAFLAEARRIGVQASLEAFRARLLEEAPPPRAAVRREGTST
jgi:MoxR-like ATPase